MSDQAHLIVGSSRESNIRMVGNCVISDSPVSVDHFNKIVAMCPKDAVLDVHAAQVMGVAIVVGPPAETRALAEAHAGEAHKRVRVIHAGLPEDALTWLAVGERGSSSEALFFNLADPPTRDTSKKSYPSDPADLRRCLLLIDQVSFVRERFDRAREISPVWARLVEAWPDLVAALDADIPGWREGKKGMARSCYDLMKRVQKEPAAEAAGA